MSKYETLVLLRRCKPLTREAQQDGIQYFYEGYDSFDKAFSSAANGDMIVTVYVKTTCRIVTKSVKEVVSE